MDGSRDGEAEIRVVGEVDIRGMMRGRWEG